MKIQRFEGRDAQEALLQARAALGPDAVILHTKRVQDGGMRQLLGKSRVEVVAATDQAPSDRASGAPSVAAPRPRATASAKTTPGGGPSVVAGGAAGWPMGPAQAAVGSGASQEIEALRQELVALRRQLSATESPTGAAPTSWMSAAEARVIASELDDSYGARDGVRGTSAWSQTERRAPAPAHGRTLAASESHNGRRAPAAPLEEMARRALSELATRTIEIREGASTTVALVGPTGVGKTTTIAKLAAIATHMERRRVAFITLDTYRIGAVEQLETYARLQDIPLSVAYLADDVRAARDRYSDHDLVLVDTIGRSPRNAHQLDELAMLLEAAAPDEVHLVLDTRGSLPTHESVLRGFRVLHPTHLLLSKLDEAARLEDSLAAALEGGLPLSYMTNGQRVPEDLAPADTAQLAAWLFGGDE